MTDLKSTILNRIDEVFAQYNQLLPDNQIDPDSITVIFDLKGTTAGKAHWGKRRLNLNLILATNNLPEFLARTVPHEIAHLYQTKIYPLSEPHGKEWKRIMRLGGYAPVRCHSYDTTGLAAYKHSYTCNCPNRVHMLSTVRHNKVASGYASYICKFCHTRIKEKK